jgi:23S rRNA (cytosine1962-C5)-methyltransferase
MKRLSEESIVERAAGLETREPTLRVLTSAGFPDYALLDSGNHRKLERFGHVTVERPEPQALWQPRLSPEAWAQADASFKSANADDDGEPGRWHKNTPVPETWHVQVLGATMLCRLSGFRHLGLFPEQVPHWQWMLDWQRQISPDPARVLNLFAYTGAASLLAAHAGAAVTHVDASKKAIAWAKENQAASALDRASIRWILEDARKFVAREVRRGRTYHLVLIDPPKFGRGPEGEVWDVFEHLPALLRDCAILLAPGRAALVLTTYAIRASALAMDALVRESLSGRPGRTESGELAVIEQSAGRLLPTSLFNRWSSDEAAR